MAPFQFEYKIEYFDSVAFHAIQGVSKKTEQI